MKRYVAAAALIALLAGGCGSDAEEAAPTTTAASSPTTMSESSTTAPESEPASGVAEPDATLPDDFPEELVGGYMPVEIDGEPLPEFTPQQADDAVGTTVPTLTGYDLDGEPIRIDPATDGPTMLVFLAHWCPHCNDEIPVINELRDAGAFDDINVVAVATASAPDRANWPPDEWLEEKGWSYPAMFDGVITVEGPSGPEQALAAMTAYGGAGFPFVAIVDGDGMLVERWSGGRSADEITASVADL